MLSGGPPFSSYLVLADGVCDVFFWSVADEFWAMGFLFKNDVLGDFSAGRWALGFLHWKSMQILNARGARGSWHP